MRSIQIMSACAALACIALAATPADACDDRYPLTCSPPIVVQPDTTRPAVAPQQQRVRAARPETARRVTLGRKPERAATRGEEAQSAQRPRRGVSAQAAARAKQRAAPAEDVKPSSANVSQKGDAEAALKDADVATPAAPAASQDEPAAVAPAIAYVDQDGINRADRPIVIVSHSELNEIDRAALPSQTSNETWLARLLAALGGAFAAASALRFLIG